MQTIDRVLSLILDIEFLKKKFTTWSKTSSMDLEVYYI